jgi:hypothetical protein
MIDLHPLANFVTKMKCEHPSISPTTVAVLDHLFFTIGNGYEVDGLGLPYEEIVEKNQDTDRWEVQGRRYLHETQTPEDVPAFLEECRRDLTELYTHDPVIEGFDQHMGMKELVDGYASMIRWEPESVDFSTEALLAELRGTEPYSDLCNVRPYPLSEEFSKAFKVTKASPEWLQETVRAQCRAWIVFLGGELDAGRVEEGSSWANRDNTVKHVGMLASLLEKLQ